jgi:hypothetical protein
MKTTREMRLKEIEKRIGKRNLVWFGTRGSDCQALLQIPQFSTVYSIISPLNSLAVQEETCLELTKKRRVDLDRYTIDTDSSQEAKELFQHLHVTLGRPTIVVMYRPIRPFTSIYFPRSAFVEYLGQFEERQSPYEHKPWVESELRNSGIRVLPWRYLSNEERPRLEEMLEQGPVVLRSNRSAGGAGLSLIHDRTEIDSAWTQHSDGFFAATPYLYPNVPLNVNACAFRDGVRGRVL